MFAFMSTNYISLSRSRQQLEWDADRLFQSGGRFTHLQSSLTIRNSSSSPFTLQVMSWVSLLIPFVVAYIAYAWHAMDKKKITAEEIEGTGHKY